MNLHEMPRGGINFLFPFHLSPSHLNVTPNFKHGLSHPYPYSVPLHYGHIISPGYPSDRLLAVGDSFPLASKCEADVAGGTDLSDPGN